MIYGFGALFVYLFIAEVNCNNCLSHKDMEADVVTPKNGVAGDSSRESQQIDHDIYCCKSNEKLERKSFKNMFIDFFDPRLIVTCIEVLKKIRPGNTRKILVLTILCQTMFFATHGEQGLVLLFARTALKWTTEFGMFVMFLTSIGLLGTGIVTVVFVNMLKIHDATLGIISILGSLIAKPIIVCIASFHIIYSLFMKGVSQFTKRRFQACLFT